MEDSNSDNTDDLLTSIDPLIFQSELLINAKDYKMNAWVQPVANKSSMGRHAVIVDDILSARSNGTGHSYIHDPPHKTALRLSQTNINSHNSVQLDSDYIDTSRTVASNIYEASVSAQSTPRNAAYNNHSSSYQSSNQMPDYLNGTSKFFPRLLNDDNSMAQLKRELEQSHRELGSVQTSCSESRTEIQRMQLTNKQLSTQLQEAKLSIQTLSVQLEQVQQECKHKENTLENLDNTLGRLVGGWKKRDHQKDQEIETLSHQIQSKDNVIDECQRIADESKTALANAVKALGMEKIKSDQTQKNFSIEIDSLKSERTQIVEDNKELAKRVMHLETEIKKMKEMYSQKNHSIEAMKQQLTGEKAFLEKENDNLRKVIEQLQEKEANQRLEIQIRDDKVDQMRQEMKILEEELSKIRKELMEKDSCLNETKVKIRGLTDDHTSAMRRLEKELQMRHQHDLNSAMASINEQHKKSLNIHNSNFQVKMNEQSKRHRLELDRLRQVAEQEITSRLADSQETIAMLRARLERSEKSIQFWQQEKESVEKARNQISVRLYEIMKLGYRDSDKDISHRNQCSAFEQPHQISVPKLINPSSYLLNLASSQITHNNLPNNYFEPIKLDNKSSTTTTTSACFTKSSPFSTMSDVQSASHQNLTLTSSINTALSY